MRRLLSLAIALAFAGVANAQKKDDWKQIAIERPGDHFMISLTNDRWLNAPDSISSHIRSGRSRGLAVALMINKPFKTDPRWSLAFGLGIGNSNILFKNMSVDVKATGTKLPFKNLDSLDRFKKYKLATTFLELPIELRYTLHPEREKKNWKFALGVKLGTMLNAHTKGKNLVDKNGGTINSYTLKESKKNFFNGTRMMATARVGLGHFSLIGTYQLNSLLKEGVGPDMKPLQIGICISGL
jgi:Outer membrane protein beta-barrel domain